MTRLLLVAAAVVALVACAGTATGATWVVDDDGGADFTTIQAAVAAASAGDTIYVHEGAYAKNVDVDKRLMLIGDGADVVTTVVQTSSTTDYVPDEASASFSVHGKAKVRSTNDTITSGLQLVQYGYGLSVYNTNDTSDTVLGNIEYTLHADNIVDVDDEEYADWNESYVKWFFPSDYFLIEDDWLWTEAETSLFEIKYVHMTICRRMNESIFDADGYQLAEFNVTFEDMNFDYYGGMIGAEEHSLVNASFVPDTFYTDAPLNPCCPFSRKNEHKIEFNLDKSQLQANKTYNFSVIAQVDLKSDNPSPILYKPYYAIWVGSNSICTTGPIGKNVTMPSEMLPEHIHYASASTNVSNTWCLFRDNQLVISLDEISESLGPKSEIHVHKEEYLSTCDTHINHDHLYNFTTDWSASVWEVENLDNVTYTITTSKNFTYIGNWERYQNGTEKFFVLPPTVEGQNYTWILPLKDRVGSEINFALDSPQIVQDNSWVDLYVNTTSEGDYTRINITVIPAISLDWINLDIRGEQIINVTAYPAVFELQPFTSSHIEFDSSEITQGQTFDFSILVDAPEEVYLWLDTTFNWVEEPPSDTITLPVAELGSVTVTADVPAIWEHNPTLPHYVQIITINMDGWLTTPQKGDLNGDKEITPADAAIALQLAVSGAHNPAADVSGDGHVTSLDALMILQASSGVIDL